MNDILTRLAAFPIQAEHPAVPELREYIRRGFSFTATANSRSWHLSDEEIQAINTGFSVLDTERRALIALVQDAAGEIERLLKLMPQHGWQSIETAPRDGTPVMIWLEDEGFAVKALWKEVPADLKEDDESMDLKMWWLPEMDVYTEDTGIHRITHWQPCLQGPNLNPQEPTS